MSEAVKWIPLPPPDEAWARYLEDGERRLREAYAGMMLPPELIGPPAPDAPPRSIGVTTR